jgi:hypothetical protein
VAILHTKTTGWGSQVVRILSGENELTQLRITAFRSHGTFQVDGEEFTIQPQGFLRFSVLLKRGVSVIARMEKPSVFRRRFLIRSAGHRLTLEARGWTGGKYLLFLENREVGSVKREGFTRRRMTLDFPDEVPLVLQVFLVYIVHLQAKREAAAAAGS